MKKFEIGQRFWDKKNAREVEVMSFNGTDYYCKTVEGADDEREGIESYQWFTACELMRTE